MATSDALDIDTVAVVPEYCHRCGSDFGRHEFDGNDLYWCPDCNLVFSQNPIPGVTLSSTTTRVRSYWTNRFPSTRAY